MRQSVQDFVVQFVTARIERFAQLKRTQSTRIVAIVQLEDGLPFGNVRQQHLKLGEIQFARLIRVHHGDHRTTNILREALFTVSLNNCGNYGGKIKIRI